MVEYVEASSSARRTYTAAVSTLLFAGAVLWFFAGTLPPPEGEPAVVLRTIADRAYVAAMLASGLHLLVATWLVWMAALTASSGQWPPVGVPMPRRERVRRVTSPSVVWLVVGALLVLKGVLVVSYWQHYLSLRDSAQLVTW